MIDLHNVYKPVVIWFGEGGGGGLEDEIHAGRFKDGLLEDNSMWDVWQVRNTPQHLQVAASGGLQSRSDIIYVVPSLGYSLFSPYIALFTMVYTTGSFLITITYKLSYTLHCMTSCFSFVLSCLKSVQKFACFLLSHRNNSSELKFAMSYNSRGQFLPGINASAATSRPVVAAPRIIRKGFVG